MKTAGPRRSTRSASTSRPAADRCSGRQLELTGLRTDGTEFQFELTVARVGSESRRAMTGFVRDITERRLLEEQLRQSQKLEAIGRLAGGVAHDFNNILMSIMGSADLLLMDVSRRGGRARRSTRSSSPSSAARPLTRQLLAFSRRQATRSRLFALGDVVGGMETMLRRLIGPKSISDRARRPAGDGRAPTRRRSSRSS